MSLQIVSTNCCDKWNRWKKSCISNAFIGFDRSILCKCTYILFIFHWCKLWLCFHIFVGPENWTSFVVSISLPTGKKNVTSQTVEVADAYESFTNEMHLKFWKLHQTCGCLSNCKLERLGGPLNEMGTVIIPRRNIASWRHLIQENARFQEVDCFIFFITKITSQKRDFLQKINSSMIAVHVRKKCFMQLIVIYFKSVCRLIHAKLNFINSFFFTSFGSFFFSEVFKNVDR